MKNLYINFLLFSLFYPNLHAMNNTIKGELFLWSTKAWPATQEQAQRLSNSLGIEIPTKTLLVWVCAHNQEYKNWNLKEYAELKNFPRNLPVHFLQNKKENDILELTIDNISIQLCCSQSKHSKGILFQNFLSSLIKTKNKKTVHFSLS